MSRRWDTSSHLLGEPPHYIILGIEYNVSFMFGGEGVSFILLLSFIFNLFQFIFRQFIFILVFMVLHWFDL